MLVIHIDVTHTVTLQTTHILPPAGTQNALDESHKKAATQQAARSITLLARCRRAHGARLGRWRSQKHRWWPSAGVSGGGRDLTLRADDPTSRGTTQPPTNPTQLKARFSCWALGTGAPHEKNVNIMPHACKPHPGGGWTKGRSALLALGETSEGRRKPNSARRAEKTGTRPGRTGRV